MMSTVKLTRGRSPGYRNHRIQRLILSFNVHEGSEGMNYEKTSWWDEALRGFQSSNLSVQGGPRLWLQFQGGPLVDIHNAAMLASCNQL